MPTVRVKPRHPITGAPMVGERVTVRYTQIVFGADDSTIARSSYLNTNAQGFADFALDASDETNPVNAQVRFSWNGVSGLLATVPSTEGPHVDGSVHYWDLEEILDPDQLEPLPTIVGVQSVTGASVDNTDPRNPVVTASGGGGDVSTVAGVSPVSGDIPHDGLAAALADEFDALGAAATAQAAAIAASQPLDSDLTAIAALTTTSFGQSVLTQADAAALRTLAGLGSAATHATGDFDAVGAAAAAQAASQPLDSDLTAIAALTTTAFGRGLLALADAAALRTAAGLGTAATSNTGDFDAAGAAAAAQAASQPLDSDLTAIAALTTTSFGRSFLALADAAAGRTLLGLGTAALSASTDFQPIDSDLTAIAALATTSFGRSLLTQADAAAARTTLGLGTLATQSGTFSGTSSGTNTGDQTITLTGDVTGSGAGSFAATLATSGVTAASYGDATHVAQVTFDAKGRATVAASVAIAIPESAVTNLTTDLAAKASVLTRTAVKTGNYTAALWDLVPCDISGGSFTVTLPAASGGKGRIAIKVVTAGNTLNLALTGSDHFNTSAGPTTGTLTLANQGIMLESDGSGIWTITADDIPLSVLDARYQPTFSIGANRYLALPLTGNPANSAQGTGFMRATPIDLPTAKTVVALGCTVGSGVASSFTRLGIYTDSGGLPTTLVVDAGQVDCSTTGTKEATISQALAAGRYWLVGCTQGANANVYTQSTAVSPLNHASAAGVGGASPAWGYFNSAGGVTGALPGSFGTASENSGGGLIRVYMKVS